MPHIHLEATANLVELGDIQKILQELTAKLSSFETVSSPAVKAYFTQRQVWAMGDGGAKGFVHCTVSVLSGRPLELRKSISTGIAELLSNSFERSLEAGDASLTVELREMDKDTYIK